MLHALADPRRREIDELLREDEQVVGDLVRRLPIAQSGVSRHLRILKEAGMVESRREGQRRVYSLRAEPFEKLSEWLAQYRRLWESRLDSFEVELDRRTSALKSSDHVTRSARPKFWRIFRLWSSVGMWIDWGFRVLSGKLVDDV